MNFRPNYPVLLDNLHRARPEDAAKFASMLVNNPEAQGGPLLDVNQGLEIMVCCVVWTELALPAWFWASWSEGESSEEQKEGLSLFRHDFVSVLMAEVATALCLNFFRVFDDVDISPPSTCFFSLAMHSSSFFVFALASDANK